MDKQYIIGIDQSTQGTKALLLDDKGNLIFRTDLPHKQIVNENGWVSHDLDEIYHNTINVVQKLIAEAKISTDEVTAVGISNQRETTAVWDRKTGEPLDYAIVWQCGRAKQISEHIAGLGYGEKIRRKTGIPLSAYFPASKMAWLLKKDNALMERARNGQICLGTIDSWLIYKLTSDHLFKTDYSNASRTQLFNIDNLCWDEEICNIFGIPKVCLAQVCDSNAVYGYTDFEGLFRKPVAINSVLGDSHAALFGQGCYEAGMIKATYGTGSSLMMNIGNKPVISKNGVVTSLAWGIDGRVNYVLEGNINYSGAVITWLKDDLKLIHSPNETQELAFRANPMDKTYLVPAFSGLGAPYWDENAVGMLYGMSRTTGREEVAKAALECIAYQITDLLYAMENDTGINIMELRTDGGATKNNFLMQFQSDISGKTVSIPQKEELSGIGAAYMAGISAGVYKQEQLSNQTGRTVFNPKMNENIRKEKYDGWKTAVSKVLVNKN